MSETHKNPNEVISSVQSTLDHFPTLEDLSKSDIVQIIHKELTGQVWKKYSMQIDDVSFEAKAIVEDVSFGDDEIDSEVIGIFMSKGLESTVSKVLAEYNVYPVPDQWQTLRVYFRGELEAQRQLDWLVYSSDILERQLSNLEMIINRQELLTAKGLVTSLKGYIEEYKKQLEKNPKTTISRAVDKAKGSIERIKKEMREICLRQIQSK